MDIDKALEKTIGRKWGRYQSFTFPLISVPYIFQALFYLSYVFTTIRSDHRQEVVLLGGGDHFLVVQLSASTPCCCAAAGATSRSARPWTPPTWSPRGFGPPSRPWGTPTR